MIGLKPVKTFYVLLSHFWQNVGLWWTDGQTDRISVRVLELMWLALLTGFWPRNTKDRVSNVAFCRSPSWCTSTGLSSRQQQHWVLLRVTALW